MRNGLRELRQAQGKTIDQVAADVGWSREHMNNMELGKSPLSSRHETMFGDYYGVPGHFIRGYPTPPPESMSSPEWHIYRIVHELDVPARAVLLWLLRSAPNGLPWRLVTKIFRLNDEAVTRLVERADALADAGLTKEP